MHPQTTETHAGYTVRSAGRQADPQDDKRMQGWRMAAGSRRGGAAHVRVPPASLPLSASVRTQNCGLTIMA